MGRLADCATALDIIARLHASLLLRSFLRMAAGELNKRGCCVNSISVHPRVFYWLCMWAGRICMCRLLSPPPLFCSSLPSTGCGLVSANTLAYVRACTRTAAVPAPSSSSHRRVAGCVCMHVEWHLAKCGSGRGNIWLIIEVPWKKYDHESVLGLRARR